jgi:hypothetical protein
MFEKIHRALIDSAEAIVNPVALLLSCGLLVYFYTNITDDLMFKVVFSVAAVYVDVLAWLTWGRAHAYKKITVRASDKDLITTYRNRMFWLRVCTFIYLILCSGPADISFFMSEINAKEQVTARIEYNDQAVKDRIAVIDSLTATYNQQLAKEAGTGYGPRAQEITQTIEGLSGERKKLLEGLAAPKKTSGKLFKNPFQGLSDVLTIPANVLKVIAFAVLVLGIQLGLLLTPWDVKLKEVSELSENLPKVSAASLITLAGQSKNPELVQVPAPTNDPDLIKFINAAYKTSEGAAGSLRGDQAISSATGIPLERCAEYKNLLCRTRVRDKPLVSKRPGVCETEFTRAEMLEHVKTGLKGVV